MPAGLSDSTETTAPVHFTKKATATFEVHVRFLVRPSKKTVPTQYTCKDAAGVCTALRNVLGQPNNFIALIDHIDVSGPFDALPDGMVLVDMPGWNTLSAAHGSQLLYDDQCRKTLVVVTPRAFNPGQLKHSMLCLDDYSSAIYSLATPLPLVSVYPGEDDGKSEEVDEEQSKGNGDVFFHKRRRELCSRAKDWGVAGALKTRMDKVFNDMLFCSMNNEQEVSELLGKIQQQQDTVFPLGENTVGEDCGQVLYDRLKTLFIEQSITPLLRRGEVWTKCSTTEGLQIVKRDLSKTLFTADILIAGALASCGLKGEAALKQMSEPRDRVDLLQTLTERIFLCTSSWTKGLSSMAMLRHLAEGGSEDDISAYDNAVAAVLSFCWDLTLPVREACTSD